jgi:hypothetical protein
MMNDERFDKLMNDAAEHYNRPPDLPPYEEMWESIEDQLNASRPEEQPYPRPFLVPQRKHWLSSSWLRMAAILILGIALGRASAVLMSEPAAPAGAGVQETAVALTANKEVRGRDFDYTHDYLGETAALLISLPEKLRADRPDPDFAARADNLLLQTRRLLESPAAADPTLRVLFEDLEMVLIQVVRLQSDPNPTKKDLLKQALEQRDVMPRLRNAVADHIAD